MSLKGRCRPNDTLAALSTRCSSFLLICVLNVSCVGAGGCNGADVVWLVIIDYWSCIRSTDAAPEPASILVGHAETLLPLLSLLGLYKDKTPPTANNYHAQHGKKTRLRPDVQSGMRKRCQVRQFTGSLLCLVSHRKKFPDQSDRPVRCQPALRPVWLPARPTAAAAHQRVSGSIPWAGGGCATLPGRPGHVSPPAGWLRLPQRVRGTGHRTRTQHRTVSRTSSSDPLWSQNQISW